ncbi:MAG: YraN family protein [Odoribacter sp.]|nr:YraN family protein [Odoribacter sp.]
MAEHNELGRLGEDKAVAYLVREGFVVLERNWRSKCGELDVICQKDGLLVVVEVKTRSGLEERPEELLDWRKRRNMRRVADAYVKAKNIRQEVRFDLVLVAGEGLEVEHIEDVIQVFE